MRRRKLRGMSPTIRTADWEHCSKLLIQMLLSYHCCVL